METPEDDQQQQDEQGAQEQAGPQQGEAPEPDQDVARNPDDERLNDIKGG